jgi:ABC-type lipoprotein release transport system permease subunit
VFAAVGIALGVTAMLACIAPATKAARIDPMIALRWE